MNGAICVAAFLVGMAVVAWVGAGYLGSSVLALAITTLIAGVYLAGGLELLRFRRETKALARAIAIAPAPGVAEPRDAQSGAAAEERSEVLGAWLAGVPETLRQAVRLRIEGERVGLPGPVLTPYLVGLLVLLGMLGTFLGMLLTLDGAVAALEGTTDLQAIRSALAAPVKGLGFAFGTSVAGVAASAMLGLVSAFSRGERTRTGQALDAQIAGPLRRFSRAHQREQALSTLRMQAMSMPALVDELRAVATQMQARDREAAERLATAQDRFHGEAREMQARFLDETRAGYLNLAESVDRTLTDSLVKSARLAGETIGPEVRAAMAGMAAETEALQQRVSNSIEQQLAAIASGFEQRSAALHDRIDRQIQSALSGLAAGVEQGTGRLLGEFAELASALQTRAAQSDAARQAAAAESDRARQAALADTLGQLAESLREEFRQLTAQGLEHQRQALASLGESVRSMADATRVEAGRTIAEVGRLAEAAARAPEAAAEVIVRMQEALSESRARDTAQLAERDRLMQSLAHLNASMSASAVDQRNAVGGLVEAARSVLDRVGDGFSERVKGEAERFAGQLDGLGERFTDRLDGMASRFDTLVGRLDGLAGGLDARSVQMADASQRLAGGAAEVASLGEAFGHAVERFAESNAQLMTALQRIEGALEKAAVRSDEQLAYYVAQARELIELSVDSQRQAVEVLQQQGAGQPVGTDARA
jgi:hypothetical protein